MPELDAGVVEEAVRRALHEDLRDVGDLTSDTIVPAGLEAGARIVAREALVLCGLALARETFAQIDPAIVFDARARDGDRVAPNSVVAQVRGSARSILRGERTALNFLMRASGVAGATASAVAELDGLPTRVLDTRKTMPGLREIDKYAVATGGGSNHRIGLFDQAMIKDTHLGAVGSITRAVEQLLARRIAPEHITVEVRDNEQLAEAIASGAGRALLDNMTLDELREAVAIGKGKIELEASGGLRPGGLYAVAATGVDAMSLGWITHSVPAADLAMEL